MNCWAMWEGDTSGRTLMVIEQEASCHEAS
jgi:hypothetical protein